MTPFLLVGLDCDQGVHAVFAIEKDEQEAIAALKNRTGGKDLLKFGVTRIAPEQMKGLHDWYIDYLENK